MPASSSSEPMEITIRKGSQGELEDFLAFTHVVQEAMEETAWFALDPDEELRELTAAGDMEFWLAEAGEGLAAVFSIIRPGLRDWNLGREIGLSGDELERVIHMDTAAVHPDFRGRGLQRRLMAAAETALPGRILLCTIHPDNRFSLNNALRLGYRIEKRIGRYGSVRFVLRKDI